MLCNSLFSEHDSRLPAFGVRRSCSATPCFQSRIHVFPPSASDDHALQLLTSEHDSRLPAFGVRRSCSKVGSTPDDRNLFAADVDDLVRRGGGVYAGHAVGLEA